MKLLCRRSIPLFVTLVAMSLAASFTSAADPATKNASVNGALSVSGKTIKLAYAVAFRDTGDDKKQVVIVLSDKELPASTWKNGLDMSDWRREHSFMGIAFWIDASNEISRCEYYDGTAFPTSVSGIFDFKIERTPGFVSGSVKSNQGAAKLRNPVTLEATFNAALK